MASIFLLAWVLLAPDQGPGDEILQAVAIPGEPWGVATVLVPVGYIEPGTALRVHIEEANGRVLYPSIVAEPLPRRTSPEPPPVRRNGRRIGNGILMDRVRKALQSTRDAVEPPKMLRISWVFQGKEPMHVRFLGDVEHQFELTPISDGHSEHRPMLAQWWQDYVRQAQEQLSAGDYPPSIQTYLVSMLAGRLHFDMPDLRSKTEAEKNVLQEPLSTLALLAGTESMRAETMRSNVRPPLEEGARRVPLPAAPAWMEARVSPVPADLPIEAIAFQIPEECFYLRFASFSNFLWFRELSARRGGDLAQLAMLRGFNYETNRRIETMLQLKTTAIAKLFGDSVVSDMAIIGNDLYLQEGPTLGILFEAKNLGLLRSSMNNDRVAVTRQTNIPNVTLTTLKIRNRDVTLLSTPDNVVRSYMVEHDRYLLVTTSRRLAERFLEVADGQEGDDDKGSLARSDHFRFARLLLPMANDYSLFAYFSPEFFRNLVSPQYQIELRRRLKAIASIEMAEMASLATQAESLSGDDVDAMVGNGLLPIWFNDRPDGARTLKSERGWIDSLRGARGSFLPIADVDILDVSHEEALRYTEQAEFYQRDWKQTDPLVVGLRRFAAPGFDDRERVALEAYVAPFGREKYGWISGFLAPPVQSQVALPEDDVANFQVHLAGSSAPRSYTPDHVLFVGLKDMIPPQPGELKGLIQILRTLKQTPAYLGAWPLPGYLDRLPLGMGGGPPDVLGFSKLLIGLWRWQGDGFSVLSFDRSILENCSSRLAMVPASDPAQVRLHARDLSGSRIATWINTFWYRRGLTTSRGNALLLDAVHQQLRVPPGDALSATERLLDCRLQCPLGGRYRLDGEQEGLWVSSAWPSVVNVKKAIATDEYMAPWLQWFKGGDAHLTQLPDKLVLVGQFDLQRLPPESIEEDAQPSLLPNMNFDLFNLPFQILGGKGDNNPDDSSKSEPNRRDF